MSKTIVRLKDLLKECNEQKKTKVEDILTEDEIDGTSMTNNPNEKYRKSRVISPVKKHRRVQDIQGFLNYCKWRIGEITEKVKPKAIFLSTLTAYKKQDFSNVGIGYQEACKDYEDLVRKAAYTDLRKKNGETFKKYNQEQKANKTIKNPKNAKAFAEAQKQFESWLSEISTFKQVISRRHPKYSRFVQTYINVPDASYLPKYVGDTLQKKAYRKILKDYQFCKNRLVFKQLKKDYLKRFFELTSPTATPVLEDAYMTIDSIIKSVNYDDLPLFIPTVPIDGDAKEPSIESKRIKGLANKVKQAVEHKQVSIEPVEKSVQTIVTSELDCFLTTLKKHGVTEITLKF